MGLGFEVWVIISERALRRTTQSGARHGEVLGKQAGHQVSKEREGVAMAEVNAFRLFR